MALVFFFRPQNYTTGMFFEGKDRMDALGVEKNVFLGSFAEYDMMARSKQMILSQQNE